MTVRKGDAGMKLHLCGFLIVAVFAPCAVAQENRVPTIPPAFPETAPYKQPVTSEELPPPVAVPPGQSRNRLSVPATPEAPAAGADWVLRRMATSEDAEVRKRASEAWPVNESVIKEMDILVYALVDPDEQVRRGAIDRLYRLESGQVFGYVMRMLVSGAAEQVRALDGALPSLEPVLAPLMAETLRTELETPQHRRIAAYCLGRMKALNAIETLGNYAVEQDGELSRTCADALYAIGTPETTSCWMPMLDHRDAYCRRLAARALACLGGPNALERLKAMLLDENEDLALQTETLQVFGERPPGVLLPLLVDVVEYNSQLRPTALRMLRTYANVDFGGDVAAWRNWLNGLMAPPPPPIVPSQ